MVSNISVIDPKLLQRTLERFGQRHYELIGHGYDNLVAVLGGKVTLRVARHADAATRQRFEAELLRFLAEHPTAPFELPQLEDYSPDPAYMVCSFVKGDIMSEDQIRQLPIADQKALGKDLATFIHWEQCLDTTAFRARVMPLAIQRDQWEAYLDRSIFKFDDKLRYPTLAKHARDLIKQFHHHYPRGLAPIANQVVHDDLFAGNLIFNDANRLSGIIDFGGATLGTAAQEMRQMYRISDAVIEACISEYQRLTGQSISLEIIRFWSVITEVAVLCERILTNRTNTPSYARARGHLRRWFPEDNWSELGVSNNNIAPQLTDT